MLLEREDGTPIEPGDDIGPEQVVLPPMEKRDTPLTYFNRLTMEQAFALCVVAKVSGCTPEAVMRTKLKRSGLTVYPNGDAPQAGAPKTEADLMAGVPFDTGPVTLDPRGVAYTMAPPAESQP